VVEARASARQKAPDARVGGEGFQEFQLADEGHADSLGRKFLHGGTRSATQAFVKRPGVLDRGDGHGDMIDNQTKHGHFQDSGAPGTGSRGRASGSAWKVYKESSMADSTNIMTITDGTFEEDVAGNDGLTMVDFWAVWCGPCRVVAPVVEELADTYVDKGLRVGKVDVDENPNISARYGIRSIPTVVFFKGGEEVDRIVGAMPKPVFEEKVQALL
jgi:thioredoxin 1